MGSCYRIKNWAKHFENNRTRTMDVMRWVPIPNKHDGDGYSEMTAGPEGAAIYGAWVTVIQVASKCQPRGTLLRAGGMPHTFESISRQVRLPSDIIKLAMERAASPSVSWLEVFDLESNALSCQAGDTKTSGGCGQTTMEGKGIEEKIVPPPKRSCSLQEMKAYGESLGYPKDCTIVVWDALEANGWMFGQNPVRDWQAAYRVKANDWRAKENQQKARASQRTAFAKPDHRAEKAAREFPENIEPKHMKILPRAQQ